MTHSHAHESLMKTYAESQNKPPFDWNAELQKKIDGEEGIDAGELDALADKWVTCAVAGQCDAILRDKHGQPEDKKLMALGLDFGWEVCQEDWLAAQTTLAKIETRSAEILAML